MTGECEVLVVFPESGSVWVRAPIEWTPLHVKGTIWEPSPVPWSANMWPHDIHVPLEFVQKVRWVADAPEFP